MATATFATLAAFKGASPAEFAPRGAANSAPIDAVIITELGVQTYFWCPGNTEPDDDVSVLRRTRTETHDGQTTTTKETGGAWKVPESDPTPNSGLGTFLRLTSYVPVTGTNADAPNFNAAMAAQAGKGTALWGSASGNGNGTAIIATAIRFSSLAKLIVVGRQSVTLLSTMTPHAPGGAEDSSIWYDDGGTTVSPTTTLAADILVNAQQATLTDASAFAGASVVNPLYVFFQHGVARRTCMRVVFRSGAVITFDRPIPKPYSSGDNATKIVGSVGHRIYGNGMKCRGPGDRAAEIINAIDWLLEDMEYLPDDLGQAMSHFVWGYDVGSMDSIMRKLKADCGGFAASAHAIEYAHGMTLEDLFGRNATGDGLLITGCDNVDVRGGMQTGHAAGAAISLTVNDATDTVGCSNVRVFGGNYQRSLYGGSVSNGSRDNKFFGSAFEGNTSAGFYMTTGSSGAASSRTSLHACPIRRNLFGVIVDNGGAGNLVYDADSVDNGDNHFIVAAGSKLTVIGGAVRDTTGVMAASHGMFAATGAGSEMRISGIYAVSTRTDGADTGYSVFVELSSSAVAYVSNCVYDRAGTNRSIGIYCNHASAKAYCDGFKQLGGSDGFFFSGIVHDVRSNVSAAAAPETNLGGGKRNRGTFTLNGTTEVQITGDFRADSNISISLKTVGGTPGVGSPYFSGAQAAGVAKVKSPTVNANDVYNWAAESRD